MRLNGEVYEDADHDEIVSPETWEKARKLREAMARSPGGARGRYPKGPHLFVKGHLRCGLCGEALIPTTKPTRTPGRLYEVYSCYGRMRNGTEYCSQKPVRREPVDSAVWRFFERVALDVDATRAAIAAAQGAKLTEIGALHQQAERDEAQAQERLTRVKRDYMDGSLDAADWQEFRDELTAEFEAARAQIEQLEQKRQALTAEV